MLIPPVPGLVRPHVDDCLQGQTSYFREDTDNLDSHQKEVSRITLDHADEACLKELEVFS